MTSTNKQAKGFQYSNSASTAICLEQPAPDNAFLTEKRYLAGYDVEALTTKVSYIDSLYLLFKQELPTPEQAKLLNALFVALMNAGPRDEAVRASMAAGVSKARPEHLLPIGLTVLGGDNNGANAVASAYTFIEQQINNCFIENENTSTGMELDVEKVEQATLAIARAIEKNKQQLATNKPSSSNSSNINPECFYQHCPGFGQHFGSADMLTARLTQSIYSLMPHSKAFVWCNVFNQSLMKYDVGISPVGLAALVFVELQLGKRESIGLYQLLRAPGILAHGMEQTHKPITSIPMLKDDDYHFSIQENDSE